MQRYGDYRLIPSYLQNSSTVCVDKQENLRQIAGIPFISVSNK